MGAHWSWPVQQQTVGARRLDEPQIHTLKEYSHGVNDPTFEYYSRWSIDGFPNPVEIYMTLERDILQPLLPLREHGHESPQSELVAFHGHSDDLVCRLTVADALVAYYPPGFLAHLAHGQRIDHSCLREPGLQRLEQAVLARLLQQGRA